MKSKSVKNISTNFDDTQRICPFCGTSYNEIKSENKAGCGFCYDIFNEDIKELIDSKTVNNSYKGKIPGKAQALVPVYKSSAITISSLSLKESKKRLLDIAIREQRFEDAAILRDEIKMLENKRRAEDYEWKSWYDNYKICPYIKA